MKGNKHTKESAKYIPFGRTDGIQAGDGFRCVCFVYVKLLEGRKARNMEEDH